jgi:hypothetical protein
MQPTLNMSKKKIPSILGSELGRLNIFYIFLWKQEWKLFFLLVHAYYISIMIQIKALGYEYRNLILLFSIHFYVGSCPIQSFFMKSNNEKYFVTVKKTGRD